MGIMAVGIPFTAAMLLYGCAAKTTPLLTQHPGYAVYREHCRRCHGDEGNALRASRMARRRVDLGSIAYRDTTTVEKITTVIGEGKGRMKGYRDQLSPQEFEAVVAYVRALPNARPAEPTR
jgi:mono/diheme cytochrome c family protein